MKGIINVIFLVVALQSACYLCSTFGILGIELSYPLGSATGIESLSGYFSLDRLGFTTLMGIGGGAAAAMVTGILTRSGTYAVYALFIFGVCAFIPLIQNFILAFPNIAMALMTALNLDSSVTTPLLATFGLWIGVWAGLYIFGLIFNREMT